MVITANSNMAKCSLVPPGDEAAGMKISSSYPACIGLAPAAGIKRSGFTGLVKVRNRPNLGLSSEPMIRLKTICDLHGPCSSCLQYFAATTKNVLINGPIPLFL